MDAHIPKVRNVVGREGIEFGKVNGRAQTEFSGPVPTFEYVVCGDRDEVALRLQLLGCEPYLACIWGSALGEDALRRAMSIVVSVKWSIAVLARLA